MLPVHQFELMIEADFVDEEIALANEVYEGIVDRTPVRTGQTRKSWNMSAHHRNTNVINVGGMKGKPLDRPMLPHVPITEFAAIFITNAKPHIMFLEFGSPTTIASAMVGATLSSI